MKTSLKIEELAQFVFGIALFSETSFSWWLFPLLILLPDIGMLGYLAGNRIGAFTYNLFHHKAIALAVLVLGYYFSIEEVILAGIILFSHAAMDRIFGYGLKLQTGFKHTHLGIIGKK